MQSYNNDTTICLDQNTINEYTFDNSKNGNVPILNNGKVSELYSSLNAICHLN